MRSVVLVMVMIAVFTLSLGYFGGFVGKVGGFSPGENVPGSPDTDDSKGENRRGQISLSWVESPGGRMCQGENYIFGARAEGPHDRLSGSPLSLEYRILSMAAAGYVEMKSVSCPDSGSCSVSREWTPDASTDYQVRARIEDGFTLSKRKSYDVKSDCPPFRLKTLEARGNGDNVKATLKFSRYLREETVSASDFEMPSEIVIQGIT
ncbi:MAG: hypothetical protein SVS85_01830, partial [Candidatus Nanohaloarchaea archaeon]|nr:hypothetical protein [Candidatus Nanohaloarchaea archaeon]